MPPNLGGFFMVRSYYPSECHADYFDFERIEALKPAIEACGISTLSQSPMLRSEERFSRNAETDLVCRLLLEKKKIQTYDPDGPARVPRVESGRNRLANSYGVELNPVSVYGQ